MTPAAMKFDCWPLYNWLRRGFSISWCGKFAHSLCSWYLSPVHRTGHVTRLRCA